MSSNNQHIIPQPLTRDNYEEAFLLYIDEELTADQKAAVEAFAAVHPDLQEELDLLMGTKLPQLDVAEVAVMDKSFLLADSMKANAIDEDLLLYIDNELDAAQKGAVEEKLQKDKDYNEQHRLLAKTKLDAAETVVYPYKAELYRRTERRIYAAWWRVAAAAVLILWAGTTTDWFDAEEATTNNSRPVALQTTTTPTTAPAANNASVANNATKEEGSEEVRNTPVTIEEVIANTGASKTIAQPQTNYRTTENTTADNAVTTAQPVASRVTAVQTSADYIPASPQQIFNDAVVTSAEPVRTISTDAHTTTPVPVEEVVATAAPEKGGSLKGFLRKTTRFIERTTSINPVNADNELLIGVLAINVK